MTHNQIASTIRNRVADGLSGNISNQAFSIQQLMDEVDTTRAKLVNTMSKSGLVDPNYLMQPIDTLPIEMLPTIDACTAYAGPCSEIPGVIVPKLMPLFGGKGIQYLGRTNMQEAIAVYYDYEDIRNHRVRIRTKNRPFGLVDVSTGADNMHRIYLFNLGKYSSLEYLKMRAVFEHPGRVSFLDPTSDTKEYPAPGHIQDAIMDALTEKYVRYFRQLNVPITTNTQSDPIT